MALIAGGNCVRAHQREAIVVIADGLRDLPSGDGVAAFTICAELAAMNVCVAISTMRACILEDQACVALHAADLGVHAAQRITRLIVIELGVGANRLPACVRMAVLAWHRYGAVWISDLCLRPADLCRRPVRRTQKICARTHERQQTESQ